MRREPILMLLLAGISMLYELNLAQCLSTLFGNSVLRYAMTIGLYLVSAGLGSMMYELIKARSHRKDLVITEIFLALLGATAPFIIVALQPFSNGLSFAVAHLFIFAIGFLTGLELPLVLGLEQNESDKFSSYVIACDYVGAVMATLLFPLLLLPTLGVFGVSVASGLLNALLAFFLSRSLTFSMRWSAMGALLASSALVFAYPYLSQLVEQIYANQ